MGEDLIMCVRLFNKTTTIKTIKNFVYYYRITDSSIFATFKRSLSYGLAWTPLFLRYFKKSQYVFLFLPLSKLLLKKYLTTLKKMFFNLFCLYTLMIYDYLF